MPGYKNVVYCTDFSANADIAFAEAKYMAGMTGAKLFVLHVTANTSAPLTAREQEQKAHQLRGAYAAEGAEYVMLYGNEAAEIMKFAEGQTDALIVLGARGVGALSGLFAGGSIADKVARNAKGPVLVVPAK